jgi:hypothetical protein
MFKKSARSSIGGFDFNLLERGSWPLSPHCGFFILHWHVDNDRAIYLVRISPAGVNIPVAKEIYVSP